MTFVVTSFSGASTAIRRVGVDVPNGAEVRNPWVYLGRRRSARLRATAGVTVGGRRSGDETIAPEFVLSSSAAGAVLCAAPVELVMQLDRCKEVAWADEDSAVGMVTEIVCGVLC